MSELKSENALKDIESSNLRSQKSPFLEQLTIKVGKSLPLENRVSDLEVRVKERV